MIELDKNYHSDLEDISFSQELRQSFPQPIAEIISYIESEEDPRQRLQALCLSLIPMTFQYFALILSSEYLFSEDPPDIDIMDNLWGMIRRPGPGKWIGFIRSATGYFSEQNTRVIPKETILAFQKTLLADKRPRVKFPDGRRLDYYEALINIRNRFAHSRQIPKDRAEEMFSDHYLIWKALISMLADAFEPRVLIVDEAGISYRPFDNREYNFESIKPTDANASLILWDDKTSAWLKLFPLVIAIYEPEAQNGEALLLEEVKGKTLLYLYRDTVIKRKDEFRHLIQLLDTRTVQVESISSDELTVSIFGERIDRITKKALMDFEDTLKYIPGLFVKRELFTQRLNSWLDDERPGCILAGNPGVGKTSLVADWCVQRRDKGDHVLLLEASKLDHSDVPKILETILNLGSTFKDCLENIHKQNKDVSSGNEPKRFILVIDAVNEFVGKENEDRTMLWREINSLIDRIDDYRPYFKCLATTRSDIWGNDFPVKRSADRALKRRLYYGDEKDDFPRIEIGTLTNEEAEEIYEKAQTSVPGMAPVTSFAKLPQSTRRLVSNPFSLRLVLQTFNEKEVPALTERKLNHQFAKEKTLAEKEKKDILFKLLERMSEVRKTEISMDEFLYGKKITSKKKDTELEKIIFDPRSESPYKQLLAEGIIEERTFGEGENAEERLMFSQEKITHIMKSEFQRRNIRRVLFISSVVILLCIIISVICYIDLLHNTEQSIQNIQELLYRSSLSREQTKLVLGKVETLVRAHSLKKTHSWILGFFLLGALIITPFLFGISKVLMSTILIRMDLPSRFVKQKLNELVRKRYIVIIFLAIILNLIYIEIKPGFTSLGLRLGTKNIITLIAMIMFGELVVKIWVVGKFAKTPSSVYNMFGLKEVKYSLLTWPLLISLIILIISVTFFIISLGFTYEPILLRKEWSESKEYATLQRKSIDNETDRKILEFIDTTLPNPDLDPEMEAFAAKFKSYYKVFIIISLVTILKLLPVYFVFQWLLASPLERFLRWKLARSP